jgi:hypothetical protein
VIVRIRADDAELDATKDRLAQRQEAKAPSKCFFSLTVAANLPGALAQVL